MTTKTKPAELRKLDRELRHLRSEYRRIAAGDGWLPPNSGMPWCSKPGGPYCEGAICLGCAIRATCQAMAQPIVEQAEALKARIAALTKPAESVIEGELFVLRAGEWVYA